MRSIRLISFLTLSLALLTACGGGRTAIEDVASRGNSFPTAKNPVDDFTGSSTGDSTNKAGLAANEVRVTVEVPTRIAPDGELTRRNLRIVEPDSLTVYRTDNTLRKLSSVDVRLRSEDNGRRVVEFVNGQPLGPDVLIEATVGNTVVRAFASDSDRDVKINPFSEYLVRYALGGYTASEFTRVMDCVNSADSTGLCLNKYVWSTLADQIQDFEIDIPDNADLASAVSFLNDRADFARYVNNMSNYALLDNASSGTVSAQSADYNSVFLGIELGQSFLVSSTHTPGQWGVISGTEELLQDQNGTGYVYPGLTLTSFDVLNIRVTSLASDIPYHRSTIAQGGDNTFYTHPDWPLNTQSSPPGAATVASDIRLLAGRSLFQSVTGRGSSQIIGWTRNPYYLNAFVGPTATDPDRVLDGYFSAGKAIELSASDGTLKRERTLENRYLSALSINLARAENFDLAQLDGQHFNVVTFATLLEDSATPVQIESGVGQWTVSGQSVSQALADVLTLERNNSGVVASGVTDHSGSRYLSQRTATLSNGERNIGRLNLDLDSAPAPGGEPDIGVGASTPDGSLLAFNLNNPGSGDGLLIAAPQTGSIPVSGTQYRVRGVLLGMESDSNTLSHFDNATLTIDNSTNATLEWSGVKVVHTVSSESVQAPTNLTEQSLTLSYSTTGDGRLVFNQTTGTLNLSGFMTDDRSQLFLRVSNPGDSSQPLGLVMATRLP
ncbi:MAG: hypothetical protein R3303_12275 [Marinobacter sp.]|nr:hypothetical protein [Marinobacter sp.]